MFIPLTFTIVVASAFQSAKAESIYDAAANNPNFSTLITAIDLAGLADAVSGNGTLTVFAPTNSAFENLQAWFVEKILDPTWKPQLQDLLMYHVLGKKVMSADVLSADIFEGLQAETLNGEKITINLNPPRVNELSNITDPFDVALDNGVIHSIDRLLIPASVTKHIVDIAGADKRFSTLANAYNTAVLWDTLALCSDGPFTVFAPTDAAFEALGDTVADLLKPENKDKLTKLLKYHIVEANVHSSTLADGEVVPTASGDSVKFAVADGSVKINGVTVTQADIITRNGIIHVIDQVLIPPEVPPELLASTDTEVDTSTQQDISLVWDIPPPAYSKVDAKVGDTLTFDWSGKHNVYIHPSNNCDMDGAILVGENTGAKHTFTAEEIGDVTFACDVYNGAHCNAGQIITYVVTDALAAGAAGGADKDVVTEKTEDVKTDETKTDETKTDETKTDKTTVPDKTETDKTTVPDETKTDETKTDEDAGSTEDAGATPEDADGVAVTLDNEDLDNASSSVPLTVASIAIVLSSLFMF